MNWEIKDRKILCSQAVNLATNVVLNQYPQGTTINDLDRFRSRVKQFADEVFIPILTGYHATVDESVLKAKLAVSDIGKIKDI